jgi:hypothetical protein
MIVFKKGELEVGNMDSMFITDYGDVTIDNFCEHQLSEECWILEVPEKEIDIQVYNAWSRDIDSIPHYDYYYEKSRDEPPDEYYDVFWSSIETYVFKSFDDAMNFMEGYQGIYKMLFELLHDSAIESKIDEEATALYKDTEGISDDTDYCLLMELKRFIECKKMDNNEVLATLKMVILDSYKFSVKEKRLSRLN